jgi:hypothetical protein
VRSDTEDITDRVIERIRFRNLGIIIGAATALVAFGPLIDGARRVYCGWPTGFDLAAAKKREAELTEAMHRADFGFGEGSDDAFAQVTVLRMQISDEERRLYYERHRTWAILEILLGVGTATTWVLAYRQIHAQLKHKY